MTDKEKQYAYRYRAAIKLDENGSPEPLDTIIKDDNYQFYRDSNRKMTKEIRQSKSTAKQSTIFAILLTLISFGPHILRML